MAELKVGEPYNEEYTFLRHVSVIPSCDGYRSRGDRALAHPGGRLQLRKRKSESASTYFYYSQKNRETINGWEDKYGGTA